MPSKGKSDELEPIYTWKDGFVGRYGLEPEAVANEIRKIERRWGRCTPELLLKEAQDETSPLHVLFNWDDQDAAHRFRMSQARRVIAAIRIVIDEAVAPVPAFVHVRTITAKGETRDGYSSIAKAMSEVDSRGSILRETLLVLQGYRRRYAMLSELASIWVAVDNAVEKYNKEVA